MIDTAFLVTALGAGAIAFANGANDNFKGVATLYGAGRLGYRRALAWAIGFARGLNDTPKIAALLLGAGAVGLHGGVVAVAVGMAAGGLLAGRRVARTLAFDITAMNDGQAFTANLVTAALVTAASPLGLPVSTTHVSCGALFGIGAATGQARWPKVAEIFGAWVTTVPLAAAVAAGLAFAARSIPS